MVTKITPIIIKPKMFPITSVCREDIIMAFEGEDKNYKSMIPTITDDEMKWIARKLADDYCEQLYWSSLRHFAKRVLTERDDE